MKTTTPPAFSTRFTVSNGYPEASYPYGKPTHGRTVWHVSSVARHECPPGSIFENLPISAWTVTRYDDARRAYRVAHSSDFRTVYFETRSLRAALSGICERCDKNGAVLLAGGGD